MKKIYTTSKMPTASHLKNSCSPYGFSFIKTLSLASVAIFLSNASPVSACDLWGNVATYFGGGADIRKSIAPVYIIDGKVYRDVGSAFAGVGSAFARWKNEVNTTINNKFNKLLLDQFVQQNAVGTITIGAQRDGSVIDIANKFHEARLITGVRNAVLGPTSDQAVNGSQLYSLGTGVARSFGGGAGYDKNGNWISPTFMVKAFDQNGNGVDKNYNSVAAAFVGVNDSFANLDKKIKNAFDTVFIGWGAWKKDIDKQFENILSDMLVKQNSAGTITIGAQRDGSAIDIANKFHKARLITGVRNGMIDSTSDQAVNGSQLYSLGTAVVKSFGGGANYKDGKWSAPTFTVKVFDKDGNGADKEYKNVADAFTGVNTSFANLDKKIENVMTNVAGDSLVKQDSTGLITIGGKVGGTRVSVANTDNAARTLSGVNAGSITATSTDAINGSQLYSMSNVVAGYFGGGAGYDKDGNWSAPTFTVKVFAKDGSGADKEYQNVADAFTGVNASFVNLDQKIENVATNVAGNSLVKQDSTGLITIGGEVSGTRVSIANTDNAARTLSGVNAGSITAISTDAINGSQLYSMNNTVASYFGGGADYKDGNWSAPTFMVKVFGKDGHGADKEYQNVADAFTGVNTSFVNLDKKIENVATNVAGNSLVKQDNTGLITIGGEVSGTRVSIANGGNGARTLSGIDAGSITMTSTDAINGSQFYMMSNELASYFSRDAGYDKDGRWIAPTFTVKVLNENGNETERRYENVADALSDVGNSFINLNQTITNVKDDTLVKQNSAGLITIGRKVSGTRVSIANTDNAARTLSGVNAGSITARSTDAINGSQFYSMSNTVASYFGGGADYKDGNWSAPTFMVKVFDKDGHGADKKYQNVADAFTGVNTSFENLDQKIENVATNVAGDSLVKQDSTGLIAIGGKVGGTGVSIANSDGTPRVLSGVNAGSITATSTDAINGSQFHTINNEVASYFSRDAGYDKDGHWIAPTFTVKVLSENGSEADMRYENVADALSGVSSSFINLNQKIKNVKGDLLVKQDSTGLITIGGIVNGKKIDIANKMGTLRVLSGVKGGAFTKTSDEAVNGAQLYFMAQTFASYLGGGAGFDQEGKWLNPTFTIKDFDKYGNETEHEYKSVAAAFAGINNTFMGLNERVMNGVGEKSALISEDFPFGRMSPLTRMSPRALNERADGDADTTPIAHDSPSKQVSFINSKNENRRLFGLSAGGISANSTDAINGAQIYEMTKQIATYFGGGAGYNEKGEWQAPTFMVNQFKDGSLSETSYGSVASAFAGMNQTLSIIDNRLSKVEKNVNSNGSSNGFPWDEKTGAYDASHNGTPSKITNVADGTIAEGSKDAVNGGQLSKMNEAVENKVTEVKNKVTEVENKVTEVEKKVDVAVSYDVKDGKKTNSIKLVGGNESEPVLIDNVAGAKIEADSKKAVNGGQLYNYTNEQMKIVLKDANEYTDKKVGNLINDSVNKANAYTDKKFEALSYEMKNVRKEARQAAAIGLAASNLRYFDDPGSLSLSFAGGLWRGQSAFAIGAGYTSEDGKIRSNLSATSAGGQWGIGGGITLKLK
ncbi:YadA-like family protein [Bartonella saheliensis]|uniref:YadA-like family protein n=1 Tax=Bartonella saheliensis TaxID=1457016 RepID=UPI00140A664B|nr:YadA-like family protein [Bartonella saheliensis]